MNRGNEMGQADSFAQFLYELKAERKSQSFDEMAERLIAERNLRKFFGGLRKKRFIVQENLDEAINFDFLIRKDDNELIGLLEHKKNGFTLSREQLDTLYHILSTNPQSKGIIFVWIMGPSYPSVSFSSFDLNKLLRQGKGIFDFSSSQLPMKESVAIFFERPKNLVIDLKPMKKTMISKADRIMLTSNFSKHIEGLFRKMKKRKFRLDNKIKAAQDFTMADVKSLQMLFNATIDKEFDRGQLESCIKKISNTRVKGKHN